MTGISLETAADRIARELAAVLGTDTAWITPRWVAEILQQPTKCSDCRRPLYAARSIALGRGPTCRSKYVQRRPGGAR
jgi:Family of unknown function (DUF6011)